MATRVYEGFEELGLAFRSCCVLQEGSSHGAKHPRAGDGAGCWDMDHLEEML